MPVKPPKFVLCPGTVRSATDGDEHWIGAYTLKKLYRLTVEEQRQCVVEQPGVSYLHLKDAIRLKPRCDGNYERFWEQRESK